MITEEKFIDHIRDNADDLNFIHKYLYSGVAYSRNFEDKLTKNIFRKYFYVEPNHTIQSTYTSKINSLFNDRQYGVLGIQAHGGSGKSTTIEMIETELTPKCNLKKIKIGFQLGDDRAIGAINRIHKHCLNNYKKKLQNDSTLLKRFRGNIDLVSSTLIELSTNNNYDMLLEYWNEVKTLQVLEFLTEKKLK